MGPLQGVRILDITTVVAGPYSTMLLGELGADVIKVEPPEGDTMRNTGYRRSHDMASIFLTLGRNKRSVVLDLKTDNARAALAKLIESVDVVVTNLRRPAAQKLGVDHESLVAINPKIISVIGLGFGDGGPYSGLPAYDDVVQALGGPVALMQKSVGEPKFFPMIMVDKTTGLALSAAVMAALFHRERTGEGQEVSVPMFELTVGFSLVEHLYDATFDPPEGNMGYKRVLSPDRRPYETQDGEYLCVLAYTDRHFERMFEVTDRPDLAADPLYATVRTRADRVDEVYAMMAEMMATKTADEWLPILRQAEIPSARVNQLEDLLTDPHLEAVGFWDETDHPTEGRLKLPGTAFSFSASPSGTQRPAPRLGEHTTECLTEAGLSAEEIAALG